MNTVIDHKYNTDTIKIISTVFSMLPMIFNNYFTTQSIDRIKENSRMDSCKSFFSEPIKIVDNIYIGSAFNASNKDLLQNINITDIINISDNVPNYHPEVFSYYNLIIRDDGIDLLNSEQIEIAIEKIDNSLNNILIHCFSGRSRCIIIVLCYLIKKYNYNLEDALLYIQKKKKNINPSKFLIENCKIYSDNIV